MSATTRSPSNPTSGLGHVGGQSLPASSGTSGLKKAFGRVLLSRQLPVPSSDVTPECRVPTDPSLPLNAHAKSGIHRWKLMRTL